MRSLERVKYEVEAFQEDQVLKEMVQDLEQRELDLKVARELLKDRLDAIVKDKKERSRKATARQAVNN